MKRLLLFLLAMAVMMLSGCVGRNGGLITYQDNQYGYTDYGNTGTQQTYIAQPPLPQNGSYGQAVIPSQGYNHSPGNTQVYAVPQNNRVTYQNTREGFNMSDIFAGLGFALGATDMILHYDSMQRMPRRHHYYHRPYYRW